MRIRRAIAIIAVIFGTAGAAAVPAVSAGASVHPHTYYHV